MAIFEYGEYQNTYEAPDNLVEIFENSAAKYANNLFIGEKDSSGEYQWVTYAQIATRVNNLRAGLASLGVQAGDTVGIIANNRKEGGLKLKLFEMALDAAKQKRETGKAGLKYKLLDKIVLHKIRERFGGRLVNAVTGSAPMNVEIAKFFIDVGIPTYDAYGLSETSPAITINSPLMGNRLGSVGKPINKTKVVIDRSRTGDNSDDGEIICFGPQCMIGYHNKPEKTKEVIVEMNGMRGVRTGDHEAQAPGGSGQIRGSPQQSLQGINGSFRF